MPDTTTTTHTDCIERGTTPCHGTVQPRMSLSGSGMPFLHCDRHSERSPRPRGGDPATLPPAPAGRLRPHLRRRTMGRGLTTPPDGGRPRTQRRTAPAECEASPRSEMRTRRNATPRSASNRYRINPRTTGRIVAAEIE